MVFLAVGASGARGDVDDTRDPSAGKMPPNVILILADDLGYGDVGCYGQKHIRTPRLDRMAGEGLRFTQFYAGSTVCAPSRCVLMTGLHVGHAYIRGNARNNLRPEDVTVAEVLQSAGYATALVGKWGLGHEGSSGVPTRQGFDSFLGYFGQNHAHNYYPHFLWRNEQRVSLKNVVPKPGRDGQGVASAKVEYSHDVFVAEALRFIEASKERPFFLFLALTIPHANNEAGKEGMEVPDLGEYAGRDWPPPRRAHAAMISRMDRDVGRILDRLQQLKLDERTLVLFTSDNGPHREGGYDPDWNDSNGPLRGIKRDLYEGGIRVPLIARWPGRIQPGVSEHVGHFADVMPTLAELAGEPARHALPPNLDGLSFVPTLLGRPAEQKQHDYLYWEFYEKGGSRAVRLGNYKGVCVPYHGPVQLYDLSRDVGERHDIAQQQPAVVERIRAILANARTPSELWEPPQRGEGAP
jgi:arylsulfatase A-like enzyme